jgi:hypothetical protein
MVREMSISHDYLSVRHDEPFKKHNEKDNSELINPEVQQLKAQVMKTEDHLNHRFYKFQAWNHAPDSCPILKTEPDRPHRRPKHLDIFYGDFQQKSWEKMYQRDVSQFKSYQSFLKLKSTLKKKEKQMLLKQVLREKASIKKIQNKANLEKDKEKLSSQRDVCSKPADTKNEEMFQKVYPSCSIFNLRLIPSLKRH